MKDDESIRDVEIRFTHLINNIIALGRKIRETEQVNKVLKVLTPKCLTKATVIQEIQGESTRSITALFGNLLEYEATLKVQENLHGKGKKKNLALAVEKGRDCDDEEDEDEGDLALVVRKFKMFYGNSGRYSSSRNNSRKEFQKESAPVCFECQRP